MSFYSKKLNTVSRSKLYFLLIGLIFILIEIIFSCFSDIFSSTTDRIKLKSAMFDYRKETEILCLGSSRLKAAFSPKIFTKQIKDQTGVEWSGFNGAITGANIERLEYFFNKAISKKGLKYIILEISKPQLSRKKTDIEAEKKAEDWDSKIASQVEKFSNLIAYRKSIRIDNLKNVPAIIFSDYLQGSELYKKGAISDLYVNGETEINEATIKLWEPTVYLPSPNTTELITESDILFYTFKKIVAKAKQNNVKLFFTIPPLVNNAKVKETTPKTHQRYQKLANITGHKIYNFSTKNIPELYFRDKDSHFNKKGKYLFSIMLAKLMIKENSLKQ